MSITDTEFEIIFDLDLQDNNIPSDEVNLIELYLDDILKRFLTELDEGE